LKLTYLELVGFTRRGQAKTFLKKGYKIAPN
jgi:hypothetical protein